MRLAEALSLRSDVQKRYLQLRERMNSSAKVTEGDTPAEDSKALLAESEILASQLEDLIKRINLTNLSAKTSSGRSLTDSLAQRDVLKLRISTLRGLADSASTQTTRMRPTELKTVRTVDIANLRSRADKLAQEFRTLDVEIQQANWTNDLID